MAEHKEESETIAEPSMDKDTEKSHGHDSSSSSPSSPSDTDDEKSAPVASVIQNKIYRLLGREKAVHAVFGGGKPADVFLWRNKKISGGVVCGATVIWVLFELLEYHLLTLVCNVLIISSAVSFLLSNAAAFLNKSLPRIPEVSIPEDLAVNVARSLSYEINRGFAVLREIASGRELKKFLAVISGLWVLSILGSCCNFLTLFYIVFILLHTVPVLYEKYEDKVDSFAEKATVEFKKHYAVLHAKYLSKIPRSVKMKKF